MGRSGFQSFIQANPYALAVRDREACAAFYPDLPRFGVHEIGGPIWRMFVRNGCRIVAGHCPMPSPRWNSVIIPASVVSSSDAIDDYQQGVATRRVEVVKPLGAESWGMRASGCATLDRWRLMVGQERVG